MKLSPLELHQYLNGRQENSRMESQELWEISRLSWYYASAPYWDTKKQGIITPHKIYRFPWDKIVKKAPIKLEEFKEIERKWSANKDLHHHIKKK